jgi:hypothetical protein
MKTTFFALGALASLVSAHFNLEYPPARGFDEDKLVQFPCGSFDTPSANRTIWPLSGGSIALKMGHINTNVEVLIGFGNNPGVAFNTVLRQTFQETGLGDFCMTGFSLPEGVNVTAGSNATIQVITNGDPDGGLYNCADITFASEVTELASGTCTNGTGISTGAATVTGSPNGTTTSSSPPAASSSEKPSAAAGLQAGMDGLFVVVAAAGFAMLL